MSGENRLGYSSEYTPLKQRHFRGLIRMHLIISRSVIERHSWAVPKYYYFDINAGPGIYEDLEGSPLIFLKEASSIGLDYQAVFIEKNEEYYVQLRENVEGYENVRIIHGDHNDILPRFLAGDNSKKIGLLYTDPTGSPPPFELLARFSKVYERLDIAIHLSAANIKRIRRAPQTESTETLGESLAKIDKEHWLIRESVGRHEWTFLVGTKGFRWGEWRKEGFYRLDSERGREIANELNLTVNELRDEAQMRLF